MSEYDLSFAENLSNVAATLATNGFTDPNAKRTVLYLSLLATELALKAMLERAGVPLPKIRKRSHDLAGLMRDLGKCKVTIEMTPGNLRALPATRLRSRGLNYPPAQSTVGEILGAEAKGASAYPNAVRYGPLPRHYPPSLVAAMAAEVIAFAKEHWSTVHTQ